MKILSYLIFGINFLFYCHVCCEKIELSLYANETKNSNHPRIGLAQGLVARDCAEILTYLPEAPSDVYTIYPIPGKAVSVYCDMRYRGGGWTVIQRRGEPLIPGQRLTVISALTRMQDSELYVELTDWDGSVRTASYSGFRVGDSLDEYKLTVKNFIGNAGDSLSRENGMKFSTRDRDQDTSAGSNCADVYKGGWWYGSCHLANLNGLYAPDGSNGEMVDYAVGIIWFTWKGYYYCLKKVNMKIRSKAI